MRSYRVSVAALSMVRVRSRVAPGLCVRPVRAFLASVTAALTEVCHRFSFDVLTAEASKQHAGRMLSASDAASISLTPSGQLADAARVAQHLLRAAFSLGGVLLDPERGEAAVDQRAGRHCQVFHSSCYFRRRDAAAATHRGAGETAASVVITFQHQGSAH